mgnify:CR=1 FL=1
MVFPSLLLASSFIGSKLQVAYSGFPCSFLHIRGFHFFSVSFPCLIIVFRFLWLILHGVWSHFFWLGPSFVLEFLQFHSLFLILVSLSILELASLLRAWSFLLISLLWSPLIYTRITLLILVSCLLVSFLLLIIVTLFPINWFHLLWPLVFYTSITLLVLVSLPFLITLHFVCSF